MSILTISNLEMAFGGQQIFRRLTAQINRGDHIGLVGPNGAGKTTLLRLLLKDLNPLAGNVNCPSELKIGYLPQDPTWPVGQTVFDEVYAGLGEVKLIETELRSKESEIKSAEASQSPDLNKLYIEYADLTDRFHMLGGSTAEARISGILDGLGIPDRLRRALMDTLSGGERNIVGLARILAGEHELMLLDEPGNHLDFSGLEWLENFLKQSPQAFIVVSHNRYLLDRVCTSIWELDHGKLSIYTGNYSEYRAEKLAKELRQEAAFKRAQKDIKRLEFNIQRLKSWASVYDNPKLAKTAKIFEKRVENLKRFERPKGDGKRMGFRLLTKPSGGTIALEAKGYRVQFDDAPPLLENVDFLITQGERVAFVGDNGTGKSTLLKEVVTDGRWENHVLRVGKSVTFGYYAQLGEHLDAKTSVVESCMRMTGLLRGSASDLLHRSLFTRDDLEKPVGVLSGGEKARLQLAILVQSGADMLLLDEPTNHLDIPSREVVEDALEQFPGTIVFVSHDRYFLNKLADRVMQFDPPHVRQFDGNFDDFWLKYGRERYRSENRSSTGLRRKSVKPKRTREFVGKSRHKRMKFSSERFVALEQEIKELEALKPEIETELRTLEQKGKIVRAERRRKRLEQVEEKLAKLYSEWMTMGEKKKKW